MNNDEKLQCISDKIIQLVSDNFNSLLANQIGLPNDMQKVDIIFKVNKAGIVANI